MEAGVQAPLTKAYLRNFTFATVETLSHFSCLTTLGLLGAAAPSRGLARHVDLNLLQGLRDLTSLQLSFGKFAGLEALRHLTSLDVAYSQVDCAYDCQFVTSLERLVVQQSDVEMFHANDVSAFGSLTFLELNEVTIEADDTVRTLDLRRIRHWVPHSLSTLKLTALIQLNLAFGEYGNYNVAVELPWIGQLTSLQELNLRAHRNFVGLSEGINRLKQLTKLEVFAAGQLSIEFNWAEVAALQEICIEGSVILDQTVLELAQLKALRCVKFSDDQCSDYSKALQSLADILSATRPDVVLDLGLQRRLYKLYDTLT